MKMACPTCGGGGGLLKPTASMSTIPGRLKTLLVALPCRACKGTGKVDLAPPV